MSRWSIVLITAAALLVGAAFGVLSLGTQQPTLASIVYPNPYDSPQQFMEGFYAADHAMEPATGTIRALIVPHHLTATATLASGMKALAGQHFTKILLLSPDHFSRCETTLCTVNATYQTEFGVVHATTATVDGLLDSPIVSSNPGLFQAEHGIYAVLPYIAHDVPGVEVTPLVISQKTTAWKNDRPKILALLQRVIDPDTVLVVSSDFSHYLPLARASQMDEATLKVLLAADLDGLASLKDPDQSDCPGCLWALGALAQERDFYHPTVVLHTNSATILGEPTIPSTTSHFAIIWKQGD